MRSPETWSLSWLVLTSEGETSTSLYGVDFPAAILPQKDKHLLGNLKCPAIFNVLDDMPAVVTLNDVSLIGKDVARDLDAFQHYQTEPLCFRVELPTLCAD